MARHIPKKVGPHPGLVWNNKILPLAAGLHQQTDVRARPEPFLDICRDAQFDEVGGLQTRHPYTGTVSPTLPDGSIFGGSLLSNVRRIERNGDELVLFTKDSLYSWNAQLNKWVLRGTHLAVSVDETPRFATTGDQISGDRAELAGTVVFAWVEGTQVYAAALDKTTGSVLVSPTAVSTAIGRPRLVALATKILFFVEASSTLLTVRAIDPAAPGTAIAGAGTTVLATDFNLYYDVVRAGTQDLVVGACRRQTTTSYTVFKVTSALAVTTSTKARTCDGPIAVATIGDGTKTQIVRGNATNIQGDLLATSTLADLFTAQAIGTTTDVPVNQIAAEFASTTCRVFWDSLETDDSLNASFAVKTNTVTTANAIGTQSTFVKRVGIASRAFLYDVNVYVWLVFGEDDASVLTGTPLGIRAALQNSYFLYRDDGLIVSKSAWQVAGGYSAVTGHLPGVAAVGAAGTEFAWAGTARRAIRLDGERVGYEARTPHDITIAFDDNAARRCARIGNTLYVSGGFVQGYDGVRLTEVGFFVVPWSIDVQDSGVAGNIEAGTYSWKGSYRYVNAQGEIERSTTATGDQITFSASHSAIVSYLFLYVTNKTTVLPSLEFWRTAKDAAPEADYLLVTGLDPTVTTGANPYINNNTGSTGTTFSDNLSDASLGDNQANPENGDVLENLAPPGAAIIVATDTRLLLGGIPGDPDRVWYSKTRSTGEIAAFNDGLTVRVPAGGGAITAMWVQDDVWYVARETALYALPGVGLDNLGQGQNYGPARIVPGGATVGAVSQESVAETPHGTIFKSEKGWQLLDRSGSIEYIGGAVADFDSEAVLATHVVETQHQVRILTAARILVWDFRRDVNQWAEWTVPASIAGVHATIWNGAHVVLANDGGFAQGIVTQRTTYSGVSYGQDAETVWIKLADYMGATSVRHIEPLGEFRSDCLVRVRVAYDYEMTGTTPDYVDDFVWSPTPAIAGKPLQFQFDPKRPQCEAIKIRLTAVSDTGAGNAALDFSAFDPFIAVVPSAAWEIGYIADFPATIGVRGNAYSMSFAFEAADPDEEFLIDNRLHFTWDTESARWRSAPNNIGLRIRAREGSSPTCGNLEDAIAAVGAGLIELDFRVTPRETLIDGDTMAGLTVGPVFFTGGAYGAPTGEAIKLTGIGIEVGTEPGLFRRLSAGQRV